MAENGDVFSDMIKSAVQDPRFAEIFSALKEKSEQGELDLSSLVGCAGGENERDSEKHRETSRETNEKSTSNSFAGGDGNIMKKLTEDFSRHRNLIAALRPYLSEGKRSAIDNLLKIGDMSSAIGTVMDLGSSVKEKG